MKSPESVEKIMWTVTACLLPSLILSTFVFGIQVLLITAVSVASCVAVEAISQKGLGRRVCVRDGSAVLTGLLIAFVIPPGVSPLLPALGAVMAIFIGKHILGGLGYNIFNPALLGRAFLLATFPVAMTSAWLQPLDATSIFHFFDSSVDAVTTATPLAVMKEQGMEAFVAQFGQGASLYKSFFLGWQPGCIGETSGFLLLLGGIFLLYRGYITWRIPVSVIGSVALLTWVFGGDTLFSGDPLLAVLTGGVMLGAIFMATDYVTGPTNKISQIVYGIGIGGLTVLIRLKGGYPEGVCYAILLMNSMSPVLDAWFKPKRFALPVGGDK
ncbi:related to Na-translocating NADH-quinone reductase, Nqr2 subunit [Desulfotalea psychrophila LSv54]|uniref:Ion-translocating oxidoreductase complex subunit D n=1 Tax=Desulfotalea psychrophila (strain LSv54 / DSM 12343) TaxID=177439 RepID=Q6AQ73_DESPS|nr:related to Na-translocating NADH-quinone reductase, Nqr2 subunit [Desulfotalea psychrophila LSv54]